MSEVVVKKSDLKVRTASAIVMVAVAGTALWVGGWWWTVFVGAVGLGVFWEWCGLVRRIALSWWGLSLWFFSGMFYVGLSAIGLIYLRMGPDSFISEPNPLGPIMNTLHILAVVIGVDVGAYFAGRALGGPKIAPKISPSKTWSGLGGGVVGAAVIGAAMSFVSDRYVRDVAEMPDAIYGYPFDPIWYICVYSLVLGVFVAVLAQAGDFFESWMKRRAGVKDSGNLIPGHGGLFDRTDGLITVSFLVGLVVLFSRSTL